MKGVILGLVIGLLTSAVAQAHPHIWLSQRVRPIVTDGKYAQIELEWRFDPQSSENEIGVIDEDKDGALSDQEVENLVAKTMAALEHDNFMTWLNTGAKDFRPTREAAFSARIEDPATFTPPDWDRNAGDREATPGAKRPKRSPPHEPRNLIYTIRLPLPQPVKAFTITTYDPEDFIRVEVDKTKVPEHCTLDKHPTYKSEFVPGHPVFADRVSCKLP
jgi:ABC-type uncharacterized transport system substrate-binding protein